MKLEEKLIDILSTRRSLMRDLGTVESLGLPDWCIAAGYVRNFVWDHIHNHTEITPLNDVDVLYYDLSDQTEETEKHYEDLLRMNQPEYNWSVKNQARMHQRNNDDQYESVEDAMKRWPETVTAIGITLDGDNKLRIIAPHGLQDLFTLTIRRSPFFYDYDYYRARVKSKNWLSIWPRLNLIDE
ncbi:nucleotidyltransferase family protein [Cohnella herbarum]|uniref:Nucleotidyltransferase family protein n=1 Tax=Cohnella herbarum TaxID=2728023 RepID=A0A7Z2VHF8_9BACL|nr:nucleotidyltransferase family protein [Cohnella herbarum]QJD83248.1 nucleotidyltransferase family protein [Cohnella herbarum]